jgi:ABC-2 type transport system ATP-binding protein
MDNAERLCDSVCIIARGEKVLDGPLSAVKAENAGRTIALAIDGGASTAVLAILKDKTLVDRSDDHNRYIEIELVAGADPQSLLKRVIETGAAIQRFERVQPSLHQIFLQRVGATGVEEGMSGHG